MEKLLQNIALPEKARQYCLELQQRFDFDFRWSAPRRTRLGDFTGRPGVRPVITVNTDLNPYAFLIPYIHETAHCAVFRRYGNRVAPHGKEWKQCFRELALPVLTAEIFPEELLYAFARYLKNPKASSSGDPNLMIAVKKYDTAEDATNKKPLKYLNEGALFVFNGKGFVKGPLRRTRVLCVETTSKKKYTIAAHALVEEQI